MEETNLNLEEAVYCKKETTYEEKIKMFKDNVVSSLFNSIFISKITELNLSEIFELLKHENALVPYLNIFRYNDKVMVFAKGEIHDDYEHGKYEILTAKDIRKYLNENYTVFIYTVFDSQDNNTELKFKTIVLKES